VPLENKPPLVESVDVGFLDPSSGQIQKRTRFSFSVGRKQGYEAGEYDVTIKDGRTDASLGGAQRVVLDGENEVIDRRAVVFSGEKKKEKKDGDADKQEEQPQKKQLTPDDPGYWEGGPKNEDEQKEQVEPKRGCGCRVGATSPSVDHVGLGAAIAALGVFGARRRGARQRKLVA
jgi:MYXO-CTERM domain-containing protein